MHHGPKTTRSNMSTTSRGRKEERTETTGLLGIVLEVKSMPRVLRAYYAQCFNTILTSAPMLETSMRYDLRQPLDTAQALGKLRVSCLACLSLCRIFHFYTYTPYILQVITSPTLLNQQNKISRGKWLPSNPGTLKPAPKQKNSLNPIP